MVKFGISGCGGFVERAALPMMKKAGNAAVAAVFDPDQERLADVCKKFAIPQACATFAELIQAQDVDVVYIASPNVMHMDQTVAAAAAGKHVFCQKPMGINAAECRQMIKACRQNNVKLGVGFCYRFGGAQKRARELVRAGAVGDVSYIHLSFNLGGYNPKTVGWRCDPKLSGGGPLMDLAPHLIDLASFFLNDRVASVMAYVRPMLTGKEIETDVLAILEFSKGARAGLDISFVRGNTHNYIITGTKGEIRAVGTMPWLTHGKRPGALTIQARGRTKELSFSHSEHLAEEIKLYCRAIEKGAEPPVAGEAGRHAQAVIDAIYRSGRTGQRCPVK